MTETAFSITSNPAAPKTPRWLTSGFATKFAAYRSFPKWDGPGACQGTRELIVRGTPFIVAYRTLSDTVHVLRVLHSARRWPSTVSKRRLGGVASARAILDDFDRMGTE